MPTTAVSARGGMHQLLVALGAIVAVTAPGSQARAPGDESVAATPTGRVPQMLASPRADPVNPAVRRPGFVLPVHRPVVDRFRSPETPWGPGNRGWEFAALAGDRVVAVGPGIVRFAGQVAGRFAVTIAHDGGMLSSVTGLTAVRVRLGEVVGVGAVLGAALPGLHLGFRLGGRYIDPAEVYGSGNHAVLVPLPR